ncbi:MAG: hypothetical protein RTU30_07420 [Candidatus Thorarchaeota archaeon]
MRKYYRVLFNQRPGDVRKQRKAIGELLSSGPATISELAPQLESSENVVLWNLIAMVRWGSVEIVEERDNELVYRLK